MSTATSLIRDGRCTAQAVLPTALGPLLLARTARGLAGAWFEAQKHHPGSIDAPHRPDDALLHAAAAQLRRYFESRQATFELPLDLLGTDFEQAVWQELLLVPAGATRSYGAIAARLGRPAASRAVGGAVGRNPLSIIVPCHRVIGSAGALTGYAGGLDRKVALLRREAAAAKPAGASTGQSTLDFAKPALAAA